MTNQRQHIPRPHPHLSNEHRTKVATKLMTLHPETPTRTWLAAAQPPLHTPPRLPRKTEKTCDIHLPTRQGHGPDRSIMTELSKFLIYELWLLLSKDCLSLEYTIYVSDVDED